jgi:phosphatidylglycerol:prolipoprotein diacylglycerol transferase
VGFNLYGVLVATGALLGLFFLRRTALLVGWTAKQASDLGFWLIIWGLLGSRLFYVLFHWGEFSSQPFKILLYWQGGLMFQGAVVAAGLAAFMILKKQGRSFWSAADAMGPPLALGQSVGRLGCYAAGCCYGQPAPGFALAVIFPPGVPAPGGFPLYPTQLMESLGLFTLSVVLWLYLRRRPAPGRVFGLYLLLAGALRLVMEQYRGDFRGLPFWGQAPTFWVALGLAAVGLWRLTRRSRSPIVEPRF